MFHIVLVNPAIPPNTGNIIRLCANAGAQLHLIEPLAFELDDKRLRRAGLDYQEWVSVKTHVDFTAFRNNTSYSRELACSTRGTQRYDQPKYQLGDALIFGSEIKGLDQSYLDQLEAQQVIRIPMLPNNRSMNLANAVSIILYEAWRQHDFAGS